MANHYKLWIKSAILGLIIISLGIFYLYFQTGNFNIILVNKALAFTAIIMIDLSFVVSGTSYFWGIGRSKLGYRKMVGVTGFAISLIHASIASYIFTGAVFWLEIFKTYPFAIFPAILAILIMIMMVVISNWGMPARLGATLWRQLLRVGYIAIFLIIIHSMLLSYDEWVSWFNTFDPILPPLSLFAFIFSVFTIAVRIALFVALKKRSALVVSQPTEP